MMLPRCISLIARKLAWDFHIFTFCVVVNIFYNNAKEWVILTFTMLLSVLMINQRNKTHLNQFLVHFSRDNKHVSLVDRILYLECMLC